MSTCSPASPPHEQNHAAFFASTLAGLLLPLAGIACLPLLGLPIPLWSQPSLVGLLWGSLFLSGCWLSLACHSTWFNLTLVALGSTLLARSFYAITDLAIEEILLASVALVVCGWLAFRIDPKPRYAIARQPIDIKVRQIPLIDLFVGMSLVACTIRAVTHLTGLPLMLIGIMGTLVIGCGSSWAAYHWVFNDTRPIGRPVLVVALLSLLMLMITAWNTPLSTVELARWLIQGPLGVVAAQSLTVLAVLAILRWRVHLSWDSVTNLSGSDGAT